MPGGKSTWVVMLAMKGHLEKNITQGIGQRRKKKKQMTTHAEVEEFVEMVDWLEEARADEVAGKDWDMQMMEMAKQLRDWEEEADNKRLEERHQLRLSHMTEEEWRDLEGNNQRHVCGERSSHHA